MNISDIGPIGRDMTGTTKRTGQTLKNGAVAGDTVEHVESAVQGETTVNSTSDTYRSSTERKRIEELAARVESESEPRSDEIERVRSRIASGYYQGDEFLGKLAFRLIQADTLA